MNKQVTELLASLIEDVLSGRFGTKNRAELVMRLIGIECALAIKTKFKP